MSISKEVIKQIFFKVGNSFIVKLLIRAGLSVTGPVGWIASFFIDKILKKAWVYVMRGWNWISEKRETKKELKEYDDKINKPDATEREIKDAQKDFLSS